MACSIPLAIVATAVVCLWPCQAEDPTRTGLAAALHQISSGCAALGDADASRISRLFPDAGNLKRSGHSATAVQLLVACHQLLRQQQPEDWQLPASTPSPVHTHTVDEVESLGREVMRLRQAAAQCEQRRTNETRELEEVDVEIEWLTLPDPKFPLLFVAIALAVLCPIICFWEACVVPKTTLFYKTEVKGEAELKSQLTRLGSSLKTPKTPALTTPETLALEPLDRPWKTCDEERFWKNVEDSCHEKEARSPEDICNAQEPTGQQVGFARFEYAVLEGNKVNISVARFGSMRGALEVTLQTRDAESFPSGYTAVDGIDFLSMKQRICFADGEEFKEVPVEIPVTTDNWRPTRWFLVELTDVSEGSQLVGPSTVFDQEFENEGKSTYARVFILQQAGWPADLPEDSRKKWAGLWLVLYYIKERIRSRKDKYWKALLGLLYVPVHDIVVTTVIQKLLIDWATHPDRASYSGWIVLLVAVQAISTGLLRYGDVVQRLNRGRTGGCRQEHRWQLLSKLLMMDFEDHFRFPDSKWFYAALVNVDVIVKDGYWQFFMLIVNIWALLLTLAMMLWSEISQQGALSWDKFVPFIAFSMVLPASLCIMLRRAGIIKKALEERMDGEQAWVDTFAWITQSGPRLYSMGPRELARLERTFTAESKLFTGRHQNARDIMADSIWVTRYMGYVLYIIFIGWVAMRLADGRQRIAAGGVPENHFGPGDFVVAARIYGKFGQSLTQLIVTIFQMLKASVSLGRVSDLLNLPEHNSKFIKAQQDMARQADANASRTPFPVPDCEASRGAVTLENTLFKPQLRKGLPVGKLDLSNAVLELPLGKVVFVRGGSEPEQMTLLSMIAGILQPTEGSRMCPENVRPAMLSSNPLGCAHTTVLEAFELSGISARVAKRLARTLGIDPAHETERLGPAQMQAVALIRLLMSNPEMIVAVRPLSIMGRVYRRRLAYLLRAWQLGVMPRTILSWLADVGDDEALPQKRGPPRTLVITGEEFFTATSEEKEEADGGTNFADHTVRLDTREWKVADSTQSLDTGKWWI